MSSMKTKLIYYIFLKLYREDWEKVNITVNDDDTVRYVQTKTFTFVPEMSGGKEDDEVTFINVIFLVRKNCYFDL